jgi:hypothetical protein
MNQNLAAHPLCDQLQRLLPFKWRKLEWLSLHNLRCWCLSTVFCSSCRVVASGMLSHRMLRSMLEPWALAVEGASMLWCLPAQ